MDVDQITKINKLADDLRRQGLAQDREEAVQMASAVFQKKAEDYTEIRQRMQQLEASSAPGSAKAPQEELSQEKVHSILEQNTQFLVKKLREFQEKLESVEQQLATLRQIQLNSRLSAPQQAAPQPVQNEGAKASEKSQAASSASHPRSGNYNETDVSIEKFFYTGRK